MLVVVEMVRTSPTYEHIAKLMMTGIAMSALFC